MDKLNYKIDVKNSLNDLEKQAIIHLYQPILGLECCQIFFSLVEEGKLMSKMPKSVFTFKRLEQLFNLNADVIKENFRKLEGMGLVKTFLNKSKNELTYKIQKPLKPSEFFDNVLFDEILKWKMDPLSYEMVKVYYCGEQAASELEVNQEVSYSFGQAFPDLIGALSNSQKEIDIELMNHELFNFANIEQFMIASNLNPTSLNKSIRKLIISNLKDSKIDEEQLKLMIKESYNFEKEEISKDTLKILLKSQIAKTEVKQAKSRSELKVQEMEEHEPEEYCELLLEQKPERHILNVISNLKTKYKLSHGVINCLLDFSYWQNNTKIVGAYLYRIAQSLNEKAISKTSEVMNYLINAKKYSKARKIKNHIKNTKETIIVNAVAPELISKNNEFKSDDSLKWLKEQMENGYKYEESNTLKPFTDIKNTK